MKNIACVLAASALLGCAHEFTTSAKTADSETSSGADVDPFNSDTTTEETTTSLYRDCLRDYEGTPNVKQFCKDYVNAWRPGDVSDADLCDPRDYYTYNHLCH